MTETTTSRKLDPVTFEVLRRGFDYACERMSQVLQKASFSPIIYDMVDFSSAVFDPDVELIGQTANCPVHIAAMHYSNSRLPIHEAIEDLFAKGGHSGKTRRFIDHRYDNRHRLSPTDQRISKLIGVHSHEVGAIYNNVIMRFNAQCSIQPTLS